VRITLNQAKHPNMCWITPHISLEDSTLTLSYSSSNPDMGEVIMECARICLMQFEGIFSLVVFACMMNKIPP
jgi:hypothetical protein